MKTTNERGVSPVIATILMVAITVVLAAVLYVMVTGLIGFEGQNAPRVAFGNAFETPIPGTFTLSASGISGGCSPNCPLGAFKVQLFNTTSTQVALCGPPPVVSSGANLCTAGGVKVAFSDANSNLKLDTLDFFTISGIASGTSYKVSLVWATTSNEVTSQTISK